MLTNALPVQDSRTLTQCQNYNLYFDITYVHLICVQYVVASMYWFTLLMLGSAIHELNASWIQMIQYLQL